jgi:environmental stress-induced protein Ves
VRIIRKAAFATTQWKNGGGVTHEIIRMPAGDDAFLWRVSIAEIGKSGPFSDFSGYERFMVLLRGSGVRLRFEDRQHSDLRQAGDLVQFDGGGAPMCELLAGPCTDLNLMVSKTIEGTRAWVESVGGMRTLDSGRGTLLVLAIGGELSIDAGKDGGASTLGEWDLAVASPGETITLRPALPGISAAPCAAAAPLVFYAALNDNSA